MPLLRAFIILALIHWPAVAVHWTFRLYSLGDFSGLFLNVMDDNDDNHEVHDLYLVFLSTWHSEKPALKGHTLSLKIIHLLILAFTINMSFWLLTFVVFRKLGLERKDTISYCWYHTKRWGKQTVSLCKKMVDNGN